MNQDILPTDELRHIAFDTETTGLDKKKDRIVELAALEFDPRTGVVGKTFHRYCNPGIEISDESQAIHGLTAEFLADKPSFADVADEFLAFVGGAHVVIHNAAFDTPMTEAELKRAGKPLFTQTVALISDTLVMSRQAVKAKKHTLDVLCDRYGVDRTQRTLHGALVDCELLAAVYPHVRTAHDRLVGSLNLLLQLPMGSEMPEDMTAKAQQIFILEAMSSMLDKERKRYLDALRPQTAGLPCQFDGWQVRFQDGITTDWAKVAAQHLVGINLGPFQKPTPKMYVERTDI